MRPLLVLLAFVPLIVRPATAQDLQLAAVFSDHMVLQHGTKVPIWGRARPAQQVEVRIAGQTVAAVAGDDGRWQATVEPIAAGGPVTLAVRAGDQTVEVDDVLVGLVWLCSGQSNMNMRVSRSKDFEREKAAAKHPSIRMFTVERSAQPEPAARCEGSWKVCSPETVGDFSAVAYFFGRRIHAEMDLPVGLIHSSWGGTAIEAWTSMEAQKAQPALATLLADWDKRDAEYSPEKADKQFAVRLANWKKRAAKARDAGAKAPRRPNKTGDPRRNQNHPATLYNGMIAPLLPYAIDGVLWYQGERNAQNPAGAKLYKDQLQLLVSDWRARFGRGPIPFIYAQLPNFKKRQDDPGASTAWALIRESMLDARLGMKHTGMAVTIDVGEAGDIHPKNKQDVGWRMAQWALAKHYHRKSILATGPLFTQASRRGKEFVCWFECAEGMRSGDDRPLTGFALAGADRKWHWAQAKVVDNTVVVSCDAVPEPVAVRYAFGDNPACNLVNAAGIPASPFRTDRW